MISKHLAVFLCVLAAALGFFSGYLAGREAAPGRPIVIKIAVHGDIICTNSSVSGLSIETNLHE